MSKDGLKRLPDNIVAPLLRALLCIPRPAHRQLILQRADHARMPGHDQQNDYSVFRRGRQIGRIWRYDYTEHPWASKPAWHWEWRNAPAKPMPAATGRRCKPA